MRERVLSLVFLIGVLFKGLDGLVELVGGIVLAILSPSQLLNLAHRVTAKELTEDPRDIIANLIVHGAAHVNARAAGFLAAYLVLHGVVKIAIVVALLLGSRRVYPWALVALSGFLVYQTYVLIVHPSLLVLLLTVLDAVIVWLTWWEWRHGRPLRETFRSTVDWVFHRPPA